MRRSGRRAGCVLLLGATIAVGCGPAQPAPAATPAAASSRQVGLTRSTAVAVPADFPKMLGCSAEELAGPADPAVRAQLTRICDVAQTGLYALSQDTSLSPDEQRNAALLMMGAVLERMTGVLDQAAVVPPDAGTGH